MRTCAKYEPSNQHKYHIRNNVCAKNVCRNVETENFYHKYLSSESRKTSSANFGRCDTFTLPPPFCLSLSRFPAEAGFRWSLTAPFWCCAFFTLFAPLIFLLLRRSHKDIGIDSGGFFLFCGHRLRELLQCYVDTVNVFLNWSQKSWKHKNTEISS